MSGKPTPSTPFRSIDSECNLNIRQKKSLSQVFLKEQWPVEQLIQYVLAKGAKRVLEIGPGSGILTKHALKVGLQVTAVEKDPRFSGLLSETLQHDQFTIINADILKFNLSEWLEESSEPSMVIGNIPYNISTPIVEWLVKGFGGFENHLGGVFLTQLEFAKRVAATHGNKDYGSLTVYAQLRAQAEMLFSVGRDCFKPIPRVDSAVIALAKPKIIYNATILERVEKVCRTAFMQRRKKLSNSLSAFLEGRDLEKCPIDLTLRAERLSPQDFITLSEFLSKGTA